LPIKRQSLYARIRVLYALYNIQKQISMKVSATSATGKAQTSAGRAFDTVADTPILSATDRQPRQPVSTFSPTSGKLFCRNYFGFLTKVAEVGNQVADRQPDRQPL